MASNGKFFHEKCGGQLQGPLILNEVVVLIEEESFTSNTSKRRKK